MKKSHDERVATRIFQLSASKEKARRDAHFLSEDHKDKARRDAHFLTLNLKGTLTHNLNKP